MVAKTFRHEFKYLITEYEMELIKNRIKYLMNVDKHARGEGSKYLIRSVYFDDMYDRCLFDVENGTEPRAKFRIRTYNNSPEHISLELKLKQHGMTYKRSCLLTESEVRALLKGENLALDRVHRLVQSLVVDRQINRLRPVIITEYERIPFVYQYGNVRVTFDTNLMSSGRVEQFFDDKMVKRPVLPKGVHLMEVKYDHFLPDYLYNALQISNLQRISFSKYYLCRKYSTSGGAI